MRFGRISWAAAALALAIVPAFAACGGEDEEEGSDASSDAGSDGSPSDATPARDASDAGRTLPEGATATFALLETTDLHTNIRSYDYFKLAEDKTIGFERTSTLIQQARGEFANTMLIDNGDAIQGTVLADYQALINPVACDQGLAMYNVMNAAGYDVAGIGNHEFNYGLDFLSRVTKTPFDVEGVDSGASSCAGPKFPQVLSNVFSVKTQKTIFPAQALVEKMISAKLPDGTTVKAPLRVGFLAYTPPPIMSWDKRWLDGKVFTKGVQETAKAIVDDLRSQGADLVVAIIHGGLQADVDATTKAITPTPYTPDLESQSFYLAQVPGVDAMLMGHSHQVFPNAAAANAGFNIPGVDKDAGAVNGVPAVMANFWGQHLGVVKLALTTNGKAWSIDKSQAVVEARPIATTCAGGVAAACTTGTWRTGGTCAFATACVGLADKTKVYVEADPNVASVMETEHQATIAYVKTPVGTTDFQMSTYFAEVGDVTAIQIVNQAQAAYVADYVAANLPQYASLPVLSVSAPFRSGFQGGADYTDVAAGNLAINNAADLYL
jgi:2',3'-cyclic-nucleotide 2'-phosphodiesterase/3'-nucleotidase